MKIKNRTPFLRKVTKIFLFAVFVLSIVLAGNLGKTVKANAPTITLLINGSTQPAFGSVQYSYPAQISWNVTNLEPGQRCFSSGEPSWGSNDPMPLSGSQTVYVGSGTWFYLLSCTSSSGVITKKVQATNFLDDSGFCSVFAELVHSDVTISAVDETTGTGGNISESTDTGPIFQAPDLQANLGDRIRIEWGGSGANFTGGMNAPSNIDFAPSDTLGISDGRGIYYIEHLTAFGPASAGVRACDTAPADAYVNIVQSSTPPDFSLTVTPDSQTIYTNGQASYTVTANCTGGFAGPVQNLSVNQPFTNINFSFSSPTIPCGGSTTLTATPNYSTTPQGSPQNISVTGTD